MEIRTALDWPKVEDALVTAARGIKSRENAVQVRKMILNLGKMVTELSKIELADRRSAFKSHNMLYDKMAELNMQIDSMDKWITMLLLS